MDNQLFDEFQEVSAALWKQKIQVDLKGKDYNDTLIWKTNEGIDVKPFYNAEDLKEKYAPTNSTQDWLIDQQIYVVHDNISNQKALEYIARGAESISFMLPSPIVDAEVLFNNFPFENIAVYCYPQFLDVDSIQALQLFLSSKKAKGFIAIDNIGNLVKTGNWYTGLTEDFKIVDTLLALQSNFPISIAINTATYHNAGATCVQQLAYAMAHANEYLNTFSTATYLPQLHITFKVAVGSNYFFEIAKIKALRLLWASLAKEYGVSTTCQIHAQPGIRNKTLYDYNVNMLRTTTECMSAVLGGANAITNLNYDSLFHKENEFGNRIARNQLLILKNESYFNLVTNAADGAYYIETLTDQLAEKALGIFKTIEKGGGFLSQLKSHTIQKKIKESAAAEQALFDEGKLVLIGTNKYPNPQDNMKNNLELYPFLKKDGKKTLIEPILQKRLAEPLEKQRLEDEN